ncbi:MAG: Mrp/NBP35 family ATP-binding protein [Candidatus Ratteibacteria bacterium]|nr:Mrp/NBP35 family ATP-binding protein [Candidatus Ratteibacteria bacterium]
MEDKQKIIEQQQKRADERMKKIKNKLLVLSGKGGVGKSTVAVNLAWVLSQRGMKVGILDVDIHGPNVPKMLGLGGTYLTSSGKTIEPVSTGNNLKVISIAFLLSSSDSPVIWRGPIKMTAIRQFLSDVNWGELDYLIIDAPPGTGDEPLSVCQLIKDITGAVIVTTPQEVSLLDVKKSISFIRELNVPLIGIVENMSGFICPYCGKETDIFKTGGGKRIADELNITFLGSIPLESDIVKASDEGKPFMNLDSKIESRKRFEGIVTKIIEIIQIKK